MRRLLLQGSDAIPVPERPALILTQLLQANGRIVSKEALAASIWPNEAVSDANLVQHVYLLRRLLGETARERSHILAIPRRGYRFAVPVEVTEPVLNETFTINAAELGGMVSDGDFEAFRCYCQGSYYLPQRTAPALHRAIEFFQRALGLNPHYVPALLGVAHSYYFLGAYWHMAPNITFPFALEAIEKVVALDPDNAVAHALRADCVAFYRWDWKLARTEMDLALRLNPGSGLIRNFATWLEICFGRYEEALAEARLALALEPSSLLYQLLVARTLEHSGSYDHAIALMSNIVETDESFYVARRYRAQTYLLAGDPVRALHDLQRLPTEREEDPSFRLPMLGRAYADLGDAEKAGDVFEALKTAAQTDYVAYWNLAIVATGLGLFEDAVQYLENAVECREATLVFLKSLPWFKPLEKNRRFVRLLTTIGPPSEPNRKSRVQ